MHSIAAAVLLAGSVALAAGCAQVPQGSIDDARQALEAARSAEAPEYAPEPWALARESFDSAMTEIQAQGEKLAPFRSYREASALLEKATGAANAAAVGARSAREQAKLRAEALLGEAEASLAAATRAVGKRRGAGAEVRAMKAEVESMQASLASARGSFAAGEYRIAESIARLVRNRARDVASDVAQARANPAT